jgi:hypothetical protein
MAQDKVTIGLTSEGRRALEKILSREWFSDEMDAAKFGLAISIASDSAPSVIARSDTKWNIGSIDHDGFLRTLIFAVYPTTETPYKLMESLINSGLESIAKMIDLKPTLELVDLFPQQ